MNYLANWIINKLTLLRAPFFQLSFSWKAYCGFSIFNLSRSARSSAPKMLFSSVKTLLGSQKLVLPAYFELTCSRNNSTKLRVLRFLSQNIFDFILFLSYLNRFVFLISGILITRFPDSTNVFFRFDVRTLNYRGRFYLTNIKSQAVMSF